MDSVARSYARPSIRIVCGVFIARAVIGLASAGAAVAAPVAVTFQINDSYVKDNVIAGVSIDVAASKDGAVVANGTTDRNGRLVLALEPGDYVATYKAPGCVPIEGSAIRVGPEPAVITTTLTMMMEATGNAGRARVQIVLNWGSRVSDQVQDVDAHLLCACKADGSHIYFGALQHAGEGHGGALDVDDGDWGGPETITLTDPVPGSYRYWVYDYSGASRARLGSSDVVVRVVVDDSVAGEYRMTPRIDGRVWRPFTELVVAPAGQPRISPFSAEDLDAGMDRQIPPVGDWPPRSNPDEGTSSRALGAAPTWGLGLLVLVALVLVIKLRRRLRRVS